MGLTLGRVVAQNPADPFNGANPVPPMMGPGNYGGMSNAMMAPGVGPGGGQQFVPGPPARSMQAQRPASWPGSSPQASPQDLQKAASGAGINGATLYINQMPSEQDLRNGAAPIASRRRCVV